MGINEMYDFLNEVIGIEKEALDLAFGLNGFTIKTAENILFWKTGYDDFDEYQKDLFDR